MDKVPIAYKQIGSLYPTYFVKQMINVFILLMVTFVGYYFVVVGLGMTKEVYFFGAELTAIYMVDLSCWYNILY